MKSSRVTPAGASFLLCLVLSAGLTSSAAGASPVHAASGRSVSPTVAAAPAPTIAPIVAQTVAAANPAEAQPNVPITISGLVSGAGGAPLLQGVQVAAVAMPNTYTATTIVNGSYSINVPAGSYTVVFTDPQARYLNGYYDSNAGDGSHFTSNPGAATAVVVNSSVTVNVQLGPGVHIKGTVEDTGGFSISNMQVQAFISGGYQAVTTTASNGTFAALVPDNASYIVAITDYGGTYVSGYYASTGIGHLTPVYGSATAVPVSGSDVTILIVTMAKPWSITLGASATTAKVGTSVTLTGTANQALDQTPYYCVIEDSSNTVLTHFGTGTTCTIAVSSSTLASKTYHAVVSYSDGSSPVATSNTVTVTWTPDHLVLSPSTGPIAAGGSQAYAAEGVGPGPTNTDLGDVTSATTFAIGGGGSCTGNSCTSTVAADHTVTGTDGAATGTATLHVNPGALNHLTISPANATIQFGASVTYQATGVDTYGNSLGDVTSWTTFGTSGNGSCVGSVCTPIYAGPAIIAASDNNAFGNAVLHINGATYHAMTPTRVLDTRNGTGGLSGPFTNHAARTFTVAGVPAGATAVTGNLTVTG